MNKDIEILNRCAKALVNQTPEGTILAQDLLGVVQRLRDRKVKKAFTVDYGGPKFFTREEYVNGAVYRESQEMMQDPGIYSEQYKDKLRERAAKRWDDKGEV